MYLGVTSTTVNQQIYFLDGAIILDKGSGGFVNIDTALFDFDSPIFDSGTQAVTWKLDDNDASALLIENEDAGGEDYLKIVTTNSSEKVLLPATTDITGTFQIGGTTVSSTATELNIVDGGTAASAITVADADRVVLNDNGTMKQVAASTMSTYYKSKASHPLFGNGADGAVDFSPSNTSCTNDNAAGCPASLGCASCSGGGTTGDPCICTLTKNSSLHSGVTKGSVVKNFSSLTVSNKAQIKLDTTNITNGSASGGSGSLVIRVTGDTTVAGTITTTGAGQAGYTASGDTTAAIGTVGLASACAIGGAKGTSGVTGGTGTTCSVFSWQVGDPLPPLWGAAGGKGACTASVNNTSLGFSTNQSVYSYGGGGGGGGGSYCSGATTACVNSGNGGGGIAIFTRGTLTVSGTLNSSGKDAGGVGGGGGGGSQLLVYGSISESSPTYTVSGGSGSGTVANCAGSGAGGAGNTVKVAHGLDS